MALADARLALRLRSPIAIFAEPTRLPKTLPAGIGQPCHLRPTPRLKTRKTIAPGAIRAVLGMARVFPNRTRIVNHEGRGLVETRVVSPCEMHRACRAPCCSKLRASCL